jgi:hypothetical protein
VLTNNYNRGYITNLQKEKALKVPNTTEKIKADIYYEEKEKIVIEEFKKDVFQGAQSFGQVLVYYDILRHENPEKTIEIILVAKEANNTTKGLIEFYNSNWKSMGRKDCISFQSYADLGIPYEA